MLAEFLGESPIGLPAQPPSSDPDCARLGAHLAGARTGITRDDLAYALGRTLDRIESALAHLDTALADIGMRIITAEGRVHVVGRVEHTNPTSRQRLARGDASATGREAAKVVYEVITYSGLVRDLDRPAMREAQRQGLIERKHFRRAVTPRVLGRLPADLGYEPIADSGAGPDLASAPSRAPEAPIGTGVRRVPGGLRAAHYLASSAPERLPRAAPHRAPYGERVDLSEALVAFSDKAHGRLKARLAGVEADELLWEPAPGCWSIRPAADGALAFDFGLGGTRMLPAITSSPVTTIAWRLAHIVDLLKEERCAKVLGLEPEPNAGELWLADRPEEALDYLDRAHDTWRGYLTRTDPDGWLQPVERWGNRVAFAHHILDEFVHHGAEIGVLRDLWRANHEASGLLAAVLEGDRDALRRAGDQAIAALRAERPGLLVEAASAGRWAAAQVLVELGFPSELPPGPSALHYAAGLGNLELVRSLVAAGANLDATDDKFNTTPLGWAEFIGGRLEAPGNPQASGANWPAVIDYLRSQPQP